MVLVGEAGAGKSTTAMALVERTGATFLADDIVPVDWQNGIALVPPIDDHFWLTADSAAWFGLQVSPGRKLPHAPRERATSAEALRAVVHLAFDRGGGSVSWEELKGQEKFMVLSRAQVCYSTFEEDDTLRNLEARALLAASVPVFRLRRPRDMAGLTTIAKALQESVATLVRRVIP
jgi:predicted ATPase